MAGLEHEVQRCDHGERISGGEVCIGGDGANGGTGCGLANGAEVARAKMLDWSADIIDDAKWRMWANDLYYILEDMTKGNVTVVVRNSVITNGGHLIIEQDGFRAWRGLKVAMNPKTPARRLQNFHGGGAMQRGQG